MGSTFHALRDLKILAIQSILESRFTNISAAKPQYASSKIQSVHFGAFRLIGGVACRDFQSRLSSNTVYGQAT